MGNILPYKKRTHSEHVELNYTMNKRNKTRFLVSVRSCQTLSPSKIWPRVMFKEKTSKFIINIKTLIKISTLTFLQGNIKNGQALKHRTVMLSSDICTKTITEHWC